MSERATPDERLKVVYISPGAAGMYCGSCMNDNMIARTMMRLGHDVMLLPLYTPILTDEEDVSDAHIFYGGINVYLQEKFSLFRHLPRFLDRVLDAPWLLRSIASGSVEVDPKVLGPMTLSMAQGERGRQRKEVKRLVDWLARGERPSVVCLSNLMIGGAVPAIKRRLGVPVLLMLQGDDVFLDELPEPYRTPVIEELRALAAQFDGVVAHSRFYADYMSDYFSIPREKIRVVPLGIDGRDFQSEAAKPAHEAPAKIGYLARICPAKGLHVLVEAMIQLRRLEGAEQAELHVAGYLGPGDRDYFDKLRRRMEQEAGPGAMQYFPDLDHNGKQDFLRSLDLFSVPTVYRDPKGRYVLEALASGVPVVQPSHGAFPELLGDTGGGRLVPPEDPAALAHVLHELIQQPEERRRLGESGRAAVRERHSAEAATDAMIEVISQFVR
ncbi:MAG: glycosyltransferase family 1 protein [Planctomycetota bacterium]|nr:MAG: glycosyltransferase family 1 protein [Planctomycetota bacterium]